MVPQAFKTHQRFYGNAYPMGESFCLLVSVGTGATKSQIVPTPLRVFPDCVFYILNQNTVKSMGDFREKKIQSCFPTQSGNTRSGVRTIFDLVAPVPTLLLVRIYVKVCFLIYLMSTKWFWNSKTFLQSREIYPFISL